MKKKCEYCCSSSECTECFDIKYEVIAYEIKCNGECEKCNCYGCRKYQEEVEL